MPPSPTLASCISALVIVLRGGGAVWALPEGMVVTGGQLELQRQDANNALIQQGSQRAAADFNSFNIDAGQRLQILQPNATSTFMGRVLNGQITEIHGRLDANGRVLLINPAGVLVGPGGVVNTAGFTATTLHVDHQRFMQGGVVELKAVPGANPQASVINRGTIQINDGGFAALIAPNVVNEGVITARLGQIQLASGTAATLDISGDGLLSVALDPAVAGSITNNGTLQASHVRLGGGDAALLAAATVHQAGVIEARSIDDLLGGQITIEGQHITVRSGSRLDATGANGGGQILVGGSWQNSDPTVQQATTTTIEPGAVLDASATQTGNGGTVVAWSDIHNPDSITRVAGTLRAQGGPAGGDGGRIETSGYQLDVNGIQVNATAPEGRSGEWLLDPYNITIAASGATGTTFPTTSPYDYTASATSVILASSIETALNDGNNVTISTGASGSGSTDTGTIDVNAPIAKTTGGLATLSLIAAGEITLSESISLTDGNLILQAGGSITQPVAGKVLTVSGTTTASASSTIDLAQNNDFIGSITATSTGGGISLADLNDLSINTINSSSTLVLFAGRDISSSGAVVATGNTFITYARNVTLDNAANNLSGSIWVNNVSNVTLNNNRATSIDASTINGNLSLTTTGAISQSGALSVAGTTTLSSGSSNNITLTNTFNNFGDAISVISGNNISIYDAGSLIAGAITSDGTVALGAHTQIQLNGTIRTNLGAITLDNGSGGSTAIKLGAGAILDATNGSVSPYSAPGAPVTVDGSVTAASSDYGLTIIGGTNGDVSITGTIGAAGSGTFAPRGIAIFGNEISVAAIDGVYSISIDAYNNGGDNGSIKLKGSTYSAQSSLSFSSGPRDSSNVVSNTVLLEGGAAGSTTTLSIAGGIQFEISGTIDLNGRNLILDATGGGVAPQGATVFWIDDAVVGPGSLTINAGSGGGSSSKGSVSINHYSGTLGSSAKPLTSATLTNAYSATFNRAITAGTLVLNDADTTINLNGALNLSNPSGGLVTTSQPYALELKTGPGQTSSIAGSTTFLNTGALTLGFAGGNLIFSGGVEAKAPSSVKIEGTVAATTGAITLGDADTPINGGGTIGGSSTGDITLGPLTIAEYADFTIGTGIANNIVLSSISGNNTATNPENLWINTSGSAIINGAITNLSTLNITQAAGITFNDAVTANTISIGTVPLDGSTPNSVQFKGNLTAAELTTTSGNYGIEIVGNSNIISLPTTFNNTYFVVIGDNTLDTTIFQGGLTIPATVTAGSYLIGTIGSHGSPIQISNAFLTGNTRVDTTVASSSAGNITFNGTINGSHSLIAQSIGSIVFNSVIGASTPLGSLTITNGTTGETTFNSGANTSVIGDLSITARNISINADVISSSGNITLIGDPGSLTNGYSDGVYINGSNTDIQTLAGNISVRGRGGSNDANRAFGVHIRAGAAITAGGSGGVEITGIGGNSSSDELSTGVYISNSNSGNGVSEIITSGGAIVISGTAGGAANTNSNVGVLINNFARIAAAGSGAITINGTATDTGGSDNVGVRVINSVNAAITNPTAAITSAGGNITINGSGTSTGAAVVLRNAGRVSSGGNGNVTIVADSLVIDSNSIAAAGSITAGATGNATVTIQPRTAGTLVNVGGSDVLSGNPLTLGLSMAELDRITAGTLSLGSISSGALTVSQPFTTTTGMNLSLAAGGAMNLGSTSVSGNLSVRTSNTPITQTGPLRVGGTTALTSGSGNISLTNRGNSFAVVPISVSSTGTVEIYPCSATSCSGGDTNLALSGDTNLALISSGQARQVILTTDPGLTQANQVTALSTTALPPLRQVEVDTNADPKASGNQRFEFGNGSLDFDSGSSTCASSGGCDLQSSTATPELFRLLTKLMPPWQQSPNRSTP